MQELNFEQVEQVTGGTGCTYDGKSYSDGSRKEQEGVIMQCVNGKWVETA
ncbi:DUF1496 domain-containing protein [Arsukibacterium perlucidum]|nr:DUF1496 domain-containing protein [Arsukibacterium perlucidum]